MSADDVVAAADLHGITARVAAVAAVHHFSGAATRRVRDWALRALAVRLPAPEAATLDDLTDGRVQTLLSVVVADEMSFVARSTAPADPDLLRETAWRLLRDRPLAWRLEQDRLSEWARTAPESDLLDDDAWRTAVRTEHRAATQATGAVLAVRGARTAATSPPQPWGRPGATPRPGLSRPLCSGHCIAPARRAARDLPPTPSLRSAATPRCAPQQPERHPYAPAATARRNQGPLYPLYWFCE